MRLLCSICFDVRGARRPAVNLDYVRAYGSTPRCADCEAAAGEALDAADFAAFHGCGYVSAGEREAAARASK